jgi:uncharacterized protein YkwD
MRSADRPCVRLSALVIATLLLALSVVTPREAVASPELTHQVIVLTNEHRQAAGCAPLAWNAKLGASAQRHADDMASGNYFSHVSRNGARFTTRIVNAGYRYRAAAENIAAGQMSPEEVVATWMNSPAHRANILNCRLTEIGVGYSYNPHSTYGSYWVQNFGRSR